MTTAQQNSDSADRRDLSTAEHQQRAEKWVRDQAANNGRPPSGAAVAREFEMSPRWGQDRVNAVFPNADGRSRKTVGQEVRDRASGRADADKPIKLTVGADASARPAAPASARPSPSASARPPAPPAPTTAPIGTGSARPTGTGAAAIATPVARGSARASAQPAPAVPSGARVVAVAGFVFGTTVSVIANVLHAWIPPAAPDGVDPTKWVLEWQPSFAAQVTGAVFPLILLLSVEGISRIPWPRGVGWFLVRLVGGVVVALGSGVISYGHLHGLLVFYRYDPLSAAVGPLVIDGLMLVCGFGLVAISQAAREKAANS